VFHTLGPVYCYQSPLLRYTDGMGTPWWRPLSALLLLMLTTHSTARVIKIEPHIEDAPRLPQTCRSEISYV
jgi:hypothetical protein